MNNLLTKIPVAALATGIAGSVALDAGFAAAENLQKLSGAQIRAKFAGKQLTDEVHWREVYERDGTLRSHSTWSKKVGKWSVEADDLCFDLHEPDGGCFEVSSSGTHVVLTPKQLGLPADGVLQSISDPK